MRLRVHVDFNSLWDDEKGYININTLVDKHLLDILTQGMPLTLYDSESMEVDAIADLDKQNGRWYGIPDWSTRRDLPPLEK
jgi:hypothetical protein